MKLTDLFESRTAPLYHATDAVSAAKIIATDSLMPMTEHQLPNGYRAGPYGNTRGISLTRSLAFATGWGGVVLVLDQQKLLSRYRMIPVAYYNIGDKELSSERAMKNRREAEEFLVTDKPVMISNYLTEIIVSKNNYSDMVEDDSRYAEEDKEAYSMFHGLIDHPLLRVR